MSDENSETADVRREKEDERLSETAGRASKLMNRYSKATLAFAIAQLHTGEDRHESTRYFNILKEFMDIQPDLTRRHLYSLKKEG